MFYKLRKILFAVRHFINKYDAHNRLSSKFYTVAAANSNKMTTCTDIVWMDLEMTGLDVLKDKILEVSVLITDKDLNVKVEGPEFAINYPPAIFDTMDDWCKEHHNKSGLVKKCLESDITIAEGEKIVYDFLKKNIPKRQCALAGSSVYMDRLFLRQCMPSVDDYMHYRIIDVSTIKELARRWNPQVLAGAPTKTFTHRSMDDIKESLEELKYYRTTFFRECL